MKRKRVGIIFGGKSAEHEVSLQSAKNILEAIDKAKFDVTLIGIDKNGGWHVNETSNFLLNAENPELIALNRSGRHVALFPGQQLNQLSEADENQEFSQLDVIFPVVHGTLGEDGSLQGMMRIANLPFVGSSVLSSAICMDKDVSKRLLRAAGLNVASYISLKKHNRKNLDFQSVCEQLGLPLFIKPANLGSSVGVSKVLTQEEFEIALSTAFAFDNKILIEQSIDGREIECAVLGNERPEASLCGEIVTSNSFYSYETKYINSEGANIVVPAQLSEATSNHIRKTALKAFEVLECSGMARVDFFLTSDGKLIVNEINTLPGFTNISMYPKLWEATGLSYSDLITRLIELAIEHHHSELLLQSSTSRV
ncbi:D-alanine--D-alanine ligase [Advenella kashmirensis W13003]|uniref:D-alanine--D-alanine ligase n=1 Tax=Advenella kashmirensis W13003 TaxID=1424334 RepID=V8QVM0_9BURK|nr:D-alanine--D-alanine ligase [Advenella kashmirensis]ETF03024.1 D-alanine--D-alanine ligase [Advenella kashmirensis W13003]